jgi:choline kinase
VKTIILAAGQGFQLDHFNKLLLRDPISGQMILDQYLRLFSHTEVVVALGYKAIEVMQRYPDLQYVYNADWKMTNNSYTAALALTEEPCYLLSCDLFLDEGIVNAMEQAGPDCVLTASTDNRQLNSLNANITAEGQILELYQGKPRKAEDPEAMGVYKISSASLLREWKKNCMRHTNLFVGQNLPFDSVPIQAVDKGEHRLEEINTVFDYLRVLNRRKVSR